MKSAICCINLLISTAIFALDITHSLHTIPREMMENAHTVIRNMDLEFKVKSPSSATHTIKCLVTILSEDSPYVRLSIGYDKFRKISDIKANVYDKEGSLLRSIKKKEIKDYSAVSDFSIYEDNRILVLDLHNATYPYTVEYEYEVEMSAIFAYPDWRPQSYGTSVEKSNYTLITPSNMDVNIKECNGVLSPEDLPDSKGNNVKKWQIQNLAAIKYEPYAPDGDQIFPLLLLSPASFEIEGHIGSMESWERFSAFLYELNQGTDELSPEMKSKITALTEGLSTREKIDTLYDYLQKTMRYVSVQLGVGGWRSFDAKYVEQNKYGDCKALSTFMKAMLNEVGVQSYCAIIQNGANKSIIPEDLAQSFFNHQIVYVPSENSWLECTSTTAPRGYIGSSNSDRKALIIREHGGALIQTPKYGIEENKQIGVQTISLLENGSAHIELNHQSNGPSQDVLRYISINYDKAEQSKWLVKNLANGASIEINDFEIEVESTAPKSTLSLKGTSSRFGSKSGKRIFAPAFIFDKYENPLPKNTARNLPLSFTQSYTCIDTIKMAIPPGYGIESAPDPETIIESDFGIYQLKTNHDDTKIHLVRKLVVDTDQVDPDQYEEIYNFFQNIEKIENSKIVFIKRDS